ncbi:MAG: MFS transporter [Thermomicrobiales bacterium]
METIERVEARPVAQPPPAAQRQDFGFGLVANTLLGYTLVKGLQLTLHNLIFPLYLYSLGHDAAAIGRINAVGALVVLVVSIPLGALSDRIGLARSLAIGGLVMPLAMAGMALATSLPTLLIWFVIQQGLSVTYWTALGPLLVGAVPVERRVRAFSVNSFFLWGLGSAGSALGGLAAALAGRSLGVSPNAVEPLRVALLLNAAIMLLGAIPLWRIRNRAVVSDQPRERQPLRLVDLRLFGRLLVPDALQACGAGAVIGFLPLFFSLRFGLASDTLGWLFTATGVLGGVAALSAPAVTRRLGDTRAITILMCAVAACVVGTAAAPFLIGAILGEILRAGLRGTIDPIYAPFAMGRVAPERRGTLGGLYNVTYATGFSLGPLASGWLQVQYGFLPAFALGASCYVFAALAIRLLWSSMGPLVEER